MAKRSTLTRARCAPKKGLLITDQILTDGESVKHTCHRLSQSGCRFDSNSIFAVDLTIRRDELNATRTHFPHVPVVKRELGDEHFPIEAGIRVTERALLDALGNVRRSFWRGLAATPVGIVDGMQLPTPSGTSRARSCSPPSQSLSAGASDHGLG